MITVIFVGNHPNTHPLKKERITLITGVLALVWAMGLSMEPALAQVEIEVAFDNLQFTRPVDLQHAGDGSDRLFVVEQSGVIQVFANDPSVASASVFLDIRFRVRDTGNEEGLLGLAFHPDFTNNEFFYVDYTASSPRRTVIARYGLDPNDPNRANRDSEVIVLEIEQPFSNHNGGQIAFGPDGFLYIALGDGGGANDGLFRNGQNRSTLLGSILRIDVDNPSNGLSYGIPAGNPFVGNNQGFREEIYAYGLRNPWRFSFDSETGRLWAGDVGQGNFEEIDIIENGSNYGWNTMEGFHCFNPPLGCDESGLVLPVYEYLHDGAKSITGGYIYRGPGVPELTGQYIYGDFVDGRIWALEYVGQQVVQNTELLNTNLGIASFGVDQNNELYICAFDGRIHRFVPTGSTNNAPAEDHVLPVSSELLGNYPNPFNPRTTISYHLARTGRVQLQIFNIFGERLTILEDGVKPMGDYHVSFNATGLPSGIYFYSLTTGDFSQTKKMVLLR